MNQPIDYASPNAERPRKRWPWRWIVSAGVVVLVLGLLPNVDTRQVEIGVDTVTGSQTTRTLWFGLFTRVNTQPSPIELQLRKLNIPWTPHCKFFANTHYGLFGRAYMWEDGDAPPIYAIHGGESAFVSSSTSAELRDFVKIMQTGTPAEQEATAKAAQAKAIDWIDTH